MVKRTHLGLPPRLKGWQGNPVFQYDAGRRLAQEHARNLIVDLHRYFDILPARCRHGIVVQARHCGLVRRLRRRTFPARLSRHRASTWPSNRIRGRQRVNDAKAGVPLTRHGEHLSFREHVASHLHECVSTRRTGLALVHDNRQFEALALSGHGGYVAGSTDANDIAEMVQKMCAERKHDAMMDAVDDGPGEGACVGEMRAGESTKSSMTMRPGICVISLPDCVQRREGCRKQLEALGDAVRWQFMDAVDGRRRTEYPDCYDVKAATRIIGFPLTQSEIACFMSHQKAWSIAVETAQPIVVLEDDFELQDHFVASLDAAFQTTVHWGIFRLQAIVAENRQPLDTCNGIEIVKMLKDPLGSAGYIIRPEAARILLTESRLIYEPLDHYLEHQRYHGQRIVSVWPYSVRTADVPSTINDRPSERVVRGWKKKKRSFWRLVFRMKRMFGRL